MAYTGMECSKCCDVHGVVTALVSAVLLLAKQHAKHQVTPLASNNPKTTASQCLTCSLSCWKHKGFSLGSGISSGLMIALRGDLGHASRVEDRQRCQPPVWHISHVPNLIAGLVTSQAPGEPPCAPSNTMTMRDNIKQVSLSHLDA